MQHAAWKSGRGDLFRLKKRLSQNKDILPHLNKYARNKTCNNASFVQILCSCFIDLNLFILVKKQRVVYKNTDLVKAVCS